MLTGRRGYPHTDSTIFSGFSRAVSGTMGPPAAAAAAATPEVAAELTAGPGPAVSTDPAAEAAPAADTVRADPGTKRCAVAAVPRVSVVIPAKDEAANLPGVLAELPRGLHEVILVDGASVDGTVRTARRARPDIVVVDQTRRGKGNALACGIAACTGDVIVTLDADGSADPAEIPAFVAALVDGADFAKGSRFLPGGGSSDLTPLRRAGNDALAFVMNLLYRTSFTDLCYGYNACWRRCVDRLALPPVRGSEPAFGDGFEIETLLATHAATAGLTVAEVASYERDRWVGKSHLNTWRDGWRILRTIVRERHGAVSPTAPAAAPAQPRVPSPTANATNPTTRTAKLP
jgi:hypothetical protein